MVMSWCPVYAICIIGILIPLSVNAERRSDDSDPLSAVVQQLIGRVDHLEASKAALEAEVVSLKAKLAEKRCESGVASFHPHEQDNIVHPDGGTERIQTRHVTFPSPFPSPPALTAGLMSIDADHTTNTRINGGFSNVQTSGFDLTISEWADSHNYGIAVAWMACSH